MKRAIWQLIFLIALCIIVPIRSPVAAQAQATGPLYTVEIQGTVTAITIDYLKRALHYAESADANALIIQLSSTGGVLRDIRPFAGLIATAHIPVIIYIAPAGTQSGATGAILLSAAHISAMAPDTSFGSPTPLAEIDAALSTQTRDLLLDSVTDQMRTWNNAHTRDSSWIERAVREGNIINNTQAITPRPPMIDLVAADQQELLTLLNGRTITLTDGRHITLVTLGRTPNPIEPTLWESLRMLLATPTIAFILLIMGALAIYLELASPGTSIFAGIGVVFLIGAILGLIVLPIRWWSLLLLLGAFALIGTEFFIPTHGGLTVTGLALLIIGALTLIDTAQAPNSGIVLWAIVLVAIGLATFAGIGILLMLRNRQRPIATGREALIGQIAEVRQRLAPEGMIFVEGALWQAISEDGISEPGEWVQITAIHELHLVVRHLEEESAHPKANGP